MVALCARLRGVADPEAAAARALRRGRASRTPPTARLKGFSHGMRQRVKLAQALAHDPELLLLDEPLNGLDPAQRRGVVELIQRLGDEGRTVLVSSHVLHEVERMAPRVLVLVNGHLVASGATLGHPRADRRPAAQHPPGGRPPGAGPWRGSSWAPAWWSRCASTTARSSSSRATSSASAARCPGVARDVGRPPARGSSRSATTSRASTPTCTSAPAGWAGDRGRRTVSAPVFRLTLREPARTGRQAIALGLLAPAARSSPALVFAAAGEVEPRDLLGAPGAAPDASPR